MKKNALLKWVYILGAVLLLANVILPWVVACAENEEQPVSETPAEEVVETPDTPETPAEWQQVIEKTTDSMSTFDGGTCNDDAVACIGTTWYSDLKSAINEASNEATVSVKKSALTGWRLTVDNKNIKLDLGWNEINYNFDIYRSSIEFLNWTVNWSIYVNAMDEGEASNGIIIGTWATIASQYAVILYQSSNGKWWDGFLINIYGTLSGNLRVMWNILSWNSVINIYGEVKDWIHLNGYSTVNIFDSANIEWSETAIEVRAWIANINGWNFVSTYNNCPSVFKSNWNWSSIDWAAVWVSQHKTNLPIQVNITSWTFSWCNAVFLADPEYNTNSQNTLSSVEINISWWSFSWNVDSVKNENDASGNHLKLSVNWWTFSDTVPAEYLAEGANISVVDAEAKIWNIEYKTLADAIEASKDWDTISLLKDVEVKWKSYELNDPSSDVSLKIANKNIVIDWADKTIKYDKKPVFVSNWANYLFKIYGSTVTLKDMKITNSLWAIIVWENSNVTLNNVDLDWNDWYWIDTKVWLSSLVLNNVTRTDGLVVNNDCKIESENSCEIEPLWNKLSWTTLLTWVKAKDFNSTYNDESLYIKYFYVPVYTVTFDNDWALTSETIIYSGTVSGGQVIAPEEPTKEWYNFTGWYDWENKVVFPYVITGDKTLTGHWEAIQYTITYELSGWALSWDDTNPESYTIESDAITLNNPIRTWYTFTWWSGTDIEWTSNPVTIAKWSTWNRSYEAIWEINQYTITFDTDGWSAIATITWDYGQIVPSVANPTKECNSFAGWDKELPTTMPAENITLKATWNYTCSRSSWGGGSSRSSSNNTMNEVVLWWEVEVATWDNAEVNTWDENKLPENTDGNNWNGNDSNYDPELVAAYQWAYKNGITTMDTIEKARLKDWITRAELAKMMVVFMSWVLQKEPVITGNAGYKDVSEKGQGDLAWYIELAYQYQIMWINAGGKALQNFNPNGKVSRAEFATVLSRVLFGSKYNQDGANYYEWHIKALAESKILTNTDPKIQELRWWIILMLYRSQNSETNNVEENTAQVTTWDVAEVESGSAAEVATWTTAEIATGEVAQVTTWDVAKVESGIAAEVTTWTAAEIDTGAVVEAVTGATAETAIAEANTWDVAKVESGSTAEVATWDSK